LFGQANSALLIAALTVLGVAAPAQAEESIGGARSVVNLVTGDLPTGDKVNVFQGDDVFKDEGVRTDADSSARLVLRDNTNLLLGPSSSIKLDRFVYAGPSQPGAIAVNLVKGALRFATGDADKKAYLIKTPTAALGVRGTVLKIVSNSTKTFVVLDEGGAIACTRGASKRRCLQLTEPGQGVAITATEIKWDSHANAAVSAAIDSIADPPSAPGGGHAIAAPAVVAPAIVTPAIVTPAITTPATVTTEPPPDKRSDDNHDHDHDHDHDHGGHDGHNGHGHSGGHGHGR
jgi:hypothetical protein